MINANPSYPFVSPDDLRAQFCSALSEMYRTEVPLYGDLVSLVDEVNDGVMAREEGQGWEVGDRLRVERHGAIRLGTPSELRTITRLFRLMGMYPVGYYDLSTLGVPVHATAFRPITCDSLSTHPFRIFTSLLRPELISDSTIRQEVLSILSERDIFHPIVRQLIEKAEKQGGGLTSEDAVELVKYGLETFKWHERALVTEKMYNKMKNVHPLLADIAGFKGPHINHLTPRVLDIDKVQELMAERGIPPKDIIEGPPIRHCPILLRQTSFQALTEPILFTGRSPSPDETAPQLARGSHRARFGEIESRGCALTKKGHELYQSLMLSAGKPTSTQNNETWQSHLSSIFTPQSFPDTWSELYHSKLAYFTYSTTSSWSPARTSDSVTLDQLINEGSVKLTPIVYEDFLPASAAGIFASNLGNHKQESALSSDNGDESTERAKKELEEYVGGKIWNYFELYDKIEQESLERVKTLTGCK
ncbi:hypothetical protein CI109_103306 [Kwoniella shandongensis]|uniref:2-oxoadipate dioxygenase/decarboxylase n=1 Tax=Kwoniella shandongensis TaxID=1734106 RepID=A0A5M6BP35_9TREE|nr:uncharacterized protein CI109_007194 [Kwoniella shandongensis]KAA5524487.1 hypothetical protein CI109_007194 [Kwoniella shandongensis]